MRWVLKRRWPKADYIIGELTIDSKYFSNTLERPWLNNKNNVSCIPEGIYEVQLTYSTKFKRELPLLIDVPNRSGIRFHRGNKVGDSSGCVLVGENKKKGMVLNSTPYELKLVEMLRASEKRKEKTYLYVTQ